MPEIGAEITANTQGLADLTARYKYAALVALETDGLGFGHDRLVTLRTAEAGLAAKVAENALGYDSETSRLRREYGAAIGLILLPPALRRIHLSTIAHNRGVQAMTDFRSGTDNSDALQAQDTYLLLATGVYTPGSEIA